MNKALMRTIIAASTLVGAVHVALAQPPIIVEGRPAIPVAYGDLDLSRPAGQAVLTGRVERAAIRLCEIRFGGIASAMEERRCFRRALDGAQAQVDRAVALYGNREFADRSGLTVAVQ